MTIHVVSELPTFDSNAVIGVDTETTYRFGTKHADPHRDSLLLIQVSDGKDAWVLKPENHKAMIPLFESPVIKIIHNSIFDLQFLMQNLGVKPNKNSIWDSLFMERILNAGRKIELGHGLAAVAAQRLGIMLNKDTREEFKNHTGLSFTEDQIRYAAEDVLCLPEIYKQQVAEISKAQLGRVAGLENRVAPIIADMALLGVGYDMELWNQYLPQTYKVMDDIELEISEALDTNRQLTLFGGIRTTTNLRSSQQLLKLYQQIGMNVDSGNKTVIAAWLADHPNFKHTAVVEKIQEWKQWAYISSGAYTKEVNPITGRIHASWNQTGTDTGRISCSEPNLQNPPRPGSDRPNVRYLFVPRPGFKSVNADWHQQEPRVFAQISGDHALRKACLQTDVYLAMGEAIPSHPVRHLMKTGVLAAFYGAQPDTLASRMGISINEAEAFQKSVFDAFPDAKRFSDRLKNAARAQGMTRTLLGRVRYYPEVAEKKISNRILNEMINAPIQGTGADMLKMALVKFDDICEERQYKAWPTILIHDEIVVEAAENDAEEVYYQLVGAMEEAGKDLCPDVYIPAEGQISERWEKG